MTGIALDLDYLQLYLTNTSRALNMDFQNIFKGQHNFKTGLSRSNTALMWIFEEIYISSGANEASRAFDLDF